MQPCQFDAIGSWDAIASLGLDQELVGSRNRDPGTVIPQP